MCWSNIIQHVGPILSIILERCEHLVWRTCTVILRLKGMIWWAKFCKTGDDMSFIRSHCLCWCSTNVFSLECYLSKWETSKLQTIFGSTFSICKAWKLGKLLHINGFLLCLDPQSEIFLLILALASGWKCQFSIPPVCNQ